MRSARADSLVYSYGRGDSERAVDDVSFAVEEGEIYGLLGPNGAGKTTILKLLGTLLVPDSGVLEVLGHPLPDDERAARGRMGLAVGEFDRTFHFRLSAEENLRYFCAFYPSIPRSAWADRIDEALRAVDLADVKGMRYMNFSQGMKHRLALARALLPDPDVLLLDEPFSGVDKATTGAFLELLEDARGDTTTILATHDLRTAGDVCDRVLILRDGRKVAEEDPATLTRMSTDVTSVSLEFGSRPPQTVLGALEETPSVVRLQPGGNGELRVHLDRDRGDLREVLDRVHKAGGEPDAVHQATPTLEDVFIQLTGGNGR